MNITLKASINYLRKHMNVDEDVIFEIGAHCAQHSVTPNICAWYRDKDDFVSDWKSIGYTEEEIRALFCNGQNSEFQLLSNGNILRYVI